MSAYYTLGSVLILYMKSLILTILVVGKTTVTSILKTGNQGIEE